MKGLINKNNPLATQALNIKNFAQGGYLLISPRGDERGFVDNLLAKQGLTRHVAMIINQVAPAISIVANSDMILTLPARLAHSYAAQYDLHFLDCPVQAPDAFMTTSVIWHKRLGRHPAFQWLQDVIVELASAA